MNDDMSYMDEVEKEIRVQYAQYLKSIQSMCETTFKQAISIALYRYYKPVKYVRNYQLLKSVKSKIVDDTLNVYIDYDLLNYESAVTYGSGVGDDVSLDVPWFLTNDSQGGTGGTNGHHDRWASTIGGQFHSYEKRKYLELAQQLMETKFGVKVQIFNNQEDDLF